MSRLSEAVPTGRLTEGDWPYPWIDATNLNERQNGRVVPVAIIVAVGANTDGRWEVSGMGILETWAAVRDFAGPLALERTVLQQSLTDRLDQQILHQ